MQCLVRRCRDQIHSILFAVTGRVGSGRVGSSPVCVDDAESLWRYMCLRDDVGFHMFLFAVRVSGKFCDVWRWRSFEFRVGVFLMSVLSINVALRLQAVVFSICTTVVGADC